MISMMMIKLSNGYYRIFSQKFVLLKSNDQLFWYIDIKSKIMHTGKTPRFINAQVSNPKTDASPKITGWTPKKSPESKLKNIHP